MFPSRSVRNVNRARLLISCPDKPGIVASVSQFLYDFGANIADSDQHSTDPQTGLFFMRVEFDVPNLEERFAALAEQFEPIGKTFDMDFRFHRAGEPKRMAIFVSKEDHCLLELLWQWQSGDIGAEPVMVISNHEQSRDTVEALGIPFHFIPVDRESKLAAEQQQLELLKAGQVDVIILARYMQILSSDFVKAHEGRIINIHHSFLPAFIGRNPYGRAYDRGVKLIGATAHYVTADLDEGPIIEQDVARVDHRDDSEDLKRIGRTIEKVVLARAVKWHLEDRILIHHNKTIVFR